ncbi:retrovirus-related Pol polyprotein from transposon 412 [Trichonephila clavipes]|nr:retrovirus-related Pol polyprotein from transposon 412 [Trichonephila clavipes]
MDVHQLRSFLGLCTYNRIFVKNFSTVARPLHKLTEAKQKFIWMVDCSNAFNKLKDALTSAPILSYPEIGKQFFLDTDASHESIVAILSQEIDGQERIIAYFSKNKDYVGSFISNIQFHQKSRNKLLCGQEGTACYRKAVEHFHPYFNGRRFLLRTDHASLTWLLNFKNSEGHITRWIQRLQEYDVEIRHRKGSAHGNADALSRRPCPESCKYSSRIENFLAWQLILPKTRVSTVLKELHGCPTRGHFGVMKTLQKVRERFYWNNMRNDVEKCCRTCDPCAASKGPRKRTRGRLQLYNGERLSNE